MDKKISPNNEVTASGVPCRDSGNPPFVEEHLLCQADQYGSLNFITAFTFLLILVPSRRLKKHCNFLLRPNSACFKSVSLIKSKAPHEKVTFLKLDLGIFS